MNEVRTVCESLILEMKTCGYYMHYCTTAFKYTNMDRWLKNGMFHHRTLVVLLGEREHGIIIILVVWNGGSRRKTRFANISAQEFRGRSFTQCTSEFGWIPKTKGTTTTPTTADNNNSSNNRSNNNNHKKEKIRKTRSKENITYNNDNNNTI